MAQDDVLKHVDQLLRDRLAEQCLGFLRLVLDPHRALDDVADELAAVGVAEGGRVASSQVLAMSWRKMPATTRSRLRPG